ncbi:MAG: DUF1697 domain-containing protein [Rhodobacteraceae bacterium]|nr:DUF1697 domain-containing protein [Paracoccaceae bacterium]
MMKTYTALLRGINVGGGNKVPMADLRKLAEGLGWHGVKSYIASGNLVFVADGAPEALAETLRAAMTDQMGIEVPILVLPAADIRAALAACPWPDAQGNRVHVNFLFGEAALDAALYQALKTSDKEIIMQPGRAWIHTPNGFGASKLAIKLKKVITGSDMTARNLNTLRKLAVMVDAGQ